MASEHIIVINSHINSTIALDHLLQSMKILDDFLNFEIYIFIGGYYELDKYEITKKENITTIKCNYNSIDFNGLIGLYELYNNTNNTYIYLHDTMKVGPTFYKKLYNIKLQCNNSIRINYKSSMNIGFYKQSLINANYVFLLFIKNKNINNELYYKTLGIQFEDHIFKSDKTNIILDNYFLKSADYIHTKTDYYKTGTMRIIEPYKNLDVFKIKACWDYKLCQLKN